MTMASPSDDGSADWIPVNNTTRPTTSPPSYKRPSLQQQSVAGHKRRRNANNSHLPGYNVKRRKKSTMGKGDKDGHKTVTPDSRRKKQGKSNQDATMKDVDMSEPDKTDKATKNKEKGVLILFDNDAPISTAVNTHMHSLKQFLAEDLYEESLVPYTTFESEDPQEGHEAIKRATQLVGKMRWNVKELESGQITQCLKEGHNTQQWYELSIKAVGPDMMEEFKLTEDEVAELRVILNRLAHTKPSIIMPKQIKKSKGPATNTSRAWHGAINVLGSHYCCDEKGRLKDKQASQTKITDAFKTHKDQQKSSDKDKNNKDNKSKNNTTKKTAARTNTARVNLCFYVKTKNDKSSSDAFFNLVKDYFTRLRENDDSTVLLTWLDKNKDDAPIIDDPEDLPMKSAEFKMYTSSLNIKNKSNVWFKLRLACNDNPDNLISGYNSNNQDWFNDNNAKGYFCIVQDSGDTTILGEFIYGAPFIDPERLTSETKSLIKKRGIQTEFYFGCRARRNKTIKLDDGERPSFVDFALAPDQPIQIECDKRQAAELKIIMYELFNNASSADKRPGQYDIRFVPDARHVSSGGSDYVSKKMRTYHKHVKIMRSLRLFRTEDIRTLDTVETINGNRYTLREYIMGLTDPINPTSSLQKTTRLFNSVDFATQGRDKDSGTVYLTAYEMRETLAARVVAILPCLVHQEFGEATTKAWFHSTALHMIHSVTFNEDECGNWDGTWETPDDKFSQGILDEDMGIEVHFDDDLLKKLQSRDQHKPTTTDALSLTSFGHALGAKKAKDDDDSSDDSSSDDQSQAQASQTGVDKAARAKSSGGQAM